MKLRTALLPALFALLSTIAPACSRNAIEAVNLTIEGDRLRKVDVETAISKYEQAVQLDPTNHRILWRLAMAYRQKEAWDKVVSTLARATQLAPKYASYWYEMGYAREELAAKKTVQWEEVKEPMKKCIDADTNYADCYQELGEAYLWTDNEQEALAQYTKSIEHRPDQLRYYSRLGDLYIRLGYIDQAEKTLKAGVEFGKEGDKFLFGLHVLLSQVYQQQKNMNAMVASLEAAQRVAGDEHPEILFNLGSTYAVLDPPRKTEAIQKLNAFSKRACRSGAAQKYKDQCEQATALVAKLGGQIQ